MPAALAALACAALPAAAAATGSVSTAAGTGAFGMRDGQAAAATFMMPAAIAIAPDGSLVVSDAAAQRIREISRSGSVRTLAGSASMSGAGLSLAGGYRDGPGAVAQFNHPTGVAIDGAGNIYVADTFNHCIRKIDRAGNVSTYAGSTEAGDANGARLEARFRRPEGLAADSAGNLYVADPGTGLRKISAAGEVTTIDRATQSDNLAVCVAVYNASEGSTIFVGERYGLFVLRPDGAKERFPAATDFDSPPEQSLPPPELRRVIDAHKPLGHPTALAAVNDHTIAFADARTNTIRVLDVIHGTLRIAGGAPIDDSSGDTGGFRDGPAATAQFDAPLGIAADRSGSLYIADGGNRRIRVLAGIDYRYALSPSNGLVDPQFEGPRSEYRIAFIGNSSIWYNTDWSDSIEGQIEQKLNRDRALPGKSARVVAIRGVGTFGSASNYAQFLASAGAVNLVVLNLNAANLFTSFGNGADATVPLQADWPAQITTGLRSLRERLASHGVPLVIVGYPFVLNLAESAYSGTVADFSAVLNTNGAIEQTLGEAVHTSGAPLVDLRSQFVAYELQPDHSALYGGDDFHLSKNGRRLVAQWVAEALEKIAPWSPR